MNMQAPPIVNETPGGVDVQGVAKNQKIVIWIILVRLLLIVGGVAVAMMLGGGGQGSQASLGAMVLAMRLVQLVTFVLSIVFIVLLMTAMRTQVLWRVLAAIGLIIPLVGLIILLVVNGKATALLRANGYTVGLMGART